MKLLRKLLLTLTLIFLLGMSQFQPLTVNAAGALTGRSANEIVDMMNLGWNLGNTFDATGYSRDDIYAHEQSWGNPIVTKTLIDGVKKAGFNTIRIPVTWYQELEKDGKYTIKPEFLKRIRQVIDYAYENDMFIILNMHHEDWINVYNFDINYKNIANKHCMIWKQIADEFADYDQHLIFESMNEPRIVGIEGEWQGNKQAYEGVNYINQLFVETIRGNGKGYNSERCLLIPGYAASSSSTILNAIKLPAVNGKTDPNLIISTHCYSPYDFCLSDEAYTFDPQSYSSTSGIDILMNDLYEIFLSKNIPVIIGETSATNTNNNTEERKKWARYMGEKSALYGVPIILWDNGVYEGSGGEVHSYIHRTTGEMTHPGIIDFLQRGYSQVEKKGIYKMISNIQENAILDGYVMWSEPEGKQSFSQWDNSFIQISSKEKFYVKDSEIGIVYSGAGEPKIILDSDLHQAWWMPVDPSHIEQLDDKKVAYFSYADILQACHREGITKLSELRYLSVVATNDNITAYEINSLGLEVPLPEMPLTNPADELNEEFAVTSQPSEEPENSLEATEETAEETAEVENIMDTEDNTGSEGEAIITASYEEGEQYLLDNMQYDPKSTIKLLALAGVVFCGVLGAAIALIVFIKKKRKK